MPSRSCGVVHLRRGDAHAVVLAGFRRDFEARGNLDPLRDAVVVRNHVARIPLHRELAHHERLRSPQHSDDLAVGAAVMLDPRNANHHAVAMHGFLRGLGRNEDVAAQAFDGSVGDEKSVAVAMHVQPARGVLAAGARGDVVARSQLYQIAAGNQPFERSLQPVFALTPRSQLAQQLLERGPRVRQVFDVLK